MQKLRSLLFYFLLITSPLIHAVEPLPLNLIDLSSPAGQKLLDRSANSNTVKLLANFTTQNTQTFCGVASAVMVLNSTSIAKPIDPIYAPYPYFTQATFFNERVEQIIKADVAARIGMTLKELGQSIQSFGLNTTIYHANHLSLNEFTDILKKALSDQQFVIVNFAREGLGQPGNGHHSPIAAYAQDKKGQVRFLLLDVARYKYPSFWVSAEDLWKAANTIDNDAQASRGFLVVQP